MKERLRVAIVRHISKKNPYAYRVVSGSNPAEVWRYR